jgi:hypothetical protein
MLFACLWLSIQPRQKVSDVPSTWEWQLPFYSTLPALFTFNRQTKLITACLIVEKLCMAMVASTTSFAILTVVWLMRSSTIGQGVVFTLIQPSFSACCVVMQSRFKKKRVALGNIHLLEVIIVFQAFVYGSTFSDMFTVWKLPIYAFVSFVFGTIVVFVTALFVALPWSFEKKSQGVFEMDEPEEEDDQDISSAAKPAILPIVSFLSKRKTVVTQERADKTTPNTEDPKTKAHSRTNTETSKTRDPKAKAPSREIGKENDYADTSIYTRGNVSSPSKERGKPTSRKESFVSSKVSEFDKKFIEIPHLKPSFVDTMEIGWPTPPKRPRPERKPVTVAHKKRTHIASRNEMHRNRRRTR